jgi:hypothetical protein
LFELLKALRVLPDHDLLYHTLNNPHDRLRQSRPTTPAIGSITPLDKFAQLATNPLSFHAHTVTSRLGMCGLSRSGPAPKSVRAGISPVCLNEPAAEQAAFALAIWLGQNGEHPSLFARGPVVEEY